MRGRDLGSTVEEAIAKVGKEVKLPVGYHIEWAGEYESQKRSSKRLAIVVPITILVIFLILYTMFNSLKWVLLILANVAMAPIGGMLALLFTGHALQRVFGSRIPRAVRRLGADRRHHAGIHQPAARARPFDLRFGRGRRGAAPAADHDDHARGQLGLLPAATSRGIGSDSQKPFAIVIVGGLILALMLSVFLLPTLYVWIAGERDVLPAPEGEFE